MLAGAGHPGIAKTLHAELGSPVVILADGSLPLAVRPSATELEPLARQSGGTADGSGEYALRDHPGRAGFARTWRCNVRSRRQVSVSCSVPV